MDLGEIGCRVYLFRSGYGLVAGSCKYGDDVCMLVLWSYLRVC
jgi:hypothetical protein